MKRIIINLTLDWSLVDARIGQFSVRMFWRGSNVLLFSHILFKTTSKVYFRVMARKCFPICAPFPTNALPNSSNIVIQTMQNIGWGFGLSAESIPLLVLTIYSSQLRSICVSYGWNRKSPDRNTSTEPTPELPMQYSMRICMLQKQEWSFGGCFFVVKSTH